MPLSWNDIKNRAMAFSKELAGESSKDAEAKSFWDAFFNVFGITCRRIASFETPVKKGDGKGGYIDLLWRGRLLVEHKFRFPISGPSYAAMSCFAGQPGIMVASYSD